ncbi:MAG: class I SAM-dependent methyltransferase [Desulfobacterales bacterium]|nr:class I SAM-dependent methyltransferase [Deltaproteobacteria bacterium]NNL42055.1 class I SAM-dependent methyltransferase [Desulfobacterales bacterium]
MKRSNNIFNQDHVCPWWLISLFDNPVRRFFHQPEKIFKAYINQDMTIFDIGCGMGYFTIGLAKLLGNKGKVIAIDLQPKMLNGVKLRAAKAGVIQQVQLQQCNSDDLGINDIGDFALTFWMVHEVPDIKHFMFQIFQSLKSKGKYLLVEPIIHVSKSKFLTIMDVALHTGFKRVDQPDISFSRAVLFEK